MAHKVPVGREEKPSLRLEAPAAASPAVSGEQAGGKRRKIPRLVWVAVFVILGFSVAAGYLGYMSAREAYGSAGAGAICVIGVVVVATVLTEFLMKWRLK